MTQFTLMNPAEFYGPGVVESFSSAVGDMEEAVKCYSRGCSTASVFHLMRVMETGVRALGKKT